MRVTIYLFRSSVTSFDQVWRGVDGPPDDYEPVPLNADVPFHGEAYLQANKSATPAWLGFVSNHCDIPRASHPLNLNSSFVLVLKASERIFAVTFGHGFAALDRRKLEPDFGLKVTLNAVDPTKLRSVQARNVDPTTVSKQLVVNQDSTLAVFDVDFYQDLLAKLEGVPDDPNFGHRVSGADACYLTADFAFPELETKCSRLLTRYRSRAYKKHFSFVDQVRPIRDDTLIRVLDSKLREAMRAADTSALGFALPDIGGYEQIHSYQARRRKWTETFNDLTAPQILEAYNAAHPNAEDQSEVRLEALTGDGSPVDEFTLRECAVFQVVHHKRVYVLTLNKWYEVNAAYAAKVDAQVSRIPTLADGYLPPIATGTSEGDYNEVAANSERFAFMDKSLVRPSGAASAIEVCDLFSRSREFVHVKKHTRSATLSHLLAQGSVSARLFVDDSGYRDSFRAALPATLRELVDPEHVDPTQYSVVYAIAAPATKPVPSGLPFFTKVNMLFHQREIQRMRMEAKIFHIQEI